MRNREITEVEKAENFNQPRLEELAQKERAKIFPTKSWRNFSV